jgi:Putative amidase domain
MGEFGPTAGAWWAEPPLGNTPSWTVANTFVQHMLHYGLLKEVGGPYRPGDLIAWDWHSDGHFDHVNFVVRVDSAGTPYLVQHSRNYKVPLPLNEFLRRASRPQEHDTPIASKHLRPAHTKANLSA